MFRAARFRDVHLYQRYTEALLNGEVPYRDFFMEYPPGALAAFVPPAAATKEHYNAAFKALMALCGVASILLVTVVLVRLRASAQRVWVAALLVALSPVALGPISLNTYDAWPALLTVATLAALLFDSVAVGFALLGLAFAAKVYPLVLLPIALVFARRLRAVVAFAVVTLVCVGPFLVIAPHGLAESFRAQAARGLQLESLGAQLLVAADQLGLYAVTIAHHTKGAVTYDLRGSLPQVFAALSSALQVVAVAAVAVVFVRRRNVAAAFAASVAGFLAFSRVLSPQYLVWLVPLVVLVPSVAAWVLLGVALALDQVWFFHYRSIVELGARSWFVLTRDVLLVGLFAVVLRHAAKEEHAVALEHESPLGIPP